MKNVSSTAQPKGFWGIFFSVSWERFSFYGLRSFLILFMIQALSWEDEKAYSIYAIFMSLLYTYPILGGWLSDRFLGPRLSILVGYIHMVIAYVLLLLDRHSLLFSLALFIVGTGYVKTNFFSYLGGLFENEEASRRDAGFTYFHVGVNLGAVLAPLCGIIAQQPHLVTYLNVLPMVAIPLENCTADLGWTFGFLGAFITLMIGVLFFVFWGGRARYNDTVAVNRTSPFMKGLVVALSSGTTAFAYWILKNPVVGDWVFPIMGLFSLAFWLYVTLQTPSHIRKALSAVLVLMAANILFIAIYEQSGSAIAIFIYRYVDCKLLGIDIPSTAFQGVNPLFIIILGPLLARLWVRLDRKGIQLGAPKQFALALFQIGVGLLILFAGCAWAGAGQVAMIWVVLLFLLLASAELFSYPIGLSLVTRIAPSQYVSVMTAIWFMSFAIAHHLGGMIGRLLMCMPKDVGGNASLEGLAIYKEGFLTLAIVSVVAGLLLLLVAKPLKMWIEGEQ